MTRCKWIDFNTEYKLTPGLLVLITNKHPCHIQYNSNDYKVYKSLVAQTKVKSLPNMAGNAARSHATWKWKHVFRKMVIPGCVPITGTRLNSAGQITITIENQDQFLHLHNSYLLIEGDVLKADNTRYADDDLFTITGNELLYLFSSLKLTLAEQTVEHVNYPGQATSLLGLASYSTTYSNGCGLEQGWYPDTALMQILILILDAKHDRDT